MRKIILFITMFLFGIVLFMPKVNLYFTLENFAKKEHVEVKEGTLKDRWIDLNIKDATIFYDGIASLNANELTIAPWLFYNKVTALGISPTKEIKSMFDVTADKVSLIYSVLDYKYIMIEAEGDFGQIEGTLDVIEQKVRLILTPSQKFKNNTLVRQYFKKEEEGLVYESKL